MSAPMNSGDLTRICLVLSLFLYNMCNCDEHHVASKHKAEEAELRRCGYNLKVLWQAEVAHSPFAASPLIADVNGDGVNDVIAAPFSEAVTVLDGESGKTLEGTKWPSQNLDNSIHSSPLQYDIDGDGMLELLFVMSSGELKFYKYDGTYMPQHTVQLPPVYVLKDWHEKVQSASHSDIHMYIADHVSRTQAYLPVDPHVYATPVLVDLNRDGRQEELVIPVTYYFDEEDYRTPEKQQHLKDLKDPEFHKYLVDGVTILNLTSLQPLRHIYLDLTQVQSVSPAFALYSPTVIDLDSNGSDLEIILGTSTGSLHVLGDSGHQRKGFPMKFSGLHGQISAVDVNNDGQIELIVIDKSGNVTCITRDGAILWQGETTPAQAAGSRVTDLNADGQLDIVIAFSNGAVYALNGADGKSLPNWPIQIGSRIVSNVLLTRVGSTKRAVDVVFITEDGNLHFVSGDQTCKGHLQIGETSFVEIISHDLIVMSAGLEFIVSTNDGTLFCLGTGQEPHPEVFIGEGLYRYAQLHAWPAVTKTANDFSFFSKKTNIYVLSNTRELTEVTGGSFWLEYEIFASSKSTQDSFDIYVYYGGNLLAKDRQSSTGMFSLKVPVWPVPGRGHVTVLMINQHGQLFKDSFHIKFNQLILQDLQWLVLAPFVAMVIILLVNHGFPAKDLLPMTFPSKSR